MNRCRAANVVSLGYFRAEDQNIFVEGYATNILHRAPVVFSNCDLVVLAKWIGQTKSLFKVCKALLGDLENVLRINILKE